MKRKGGRNERDTETQSQRGKEGASTTVLTTLMATVPC